MESDDCIEANSNIQSLFKNILIGISRIEKTVSEKIEPVQKYLEEKNEYDYVIKHGLEGFKDKVIKSCNKKDVFEPQSWLLQVIQKEPSLRFPHRKILEYLSQQYDYNRKIFREVNFSTIVKECRLGKNRASEYLKLLNNKGFVKQRLDGYRVWYIIKIDSFCGNKKR